MRNIRTLLLLVFSVLVTGTAAHAEPPKVERWLPSTTVGFVQTEPFGTLLGHPLIKALRNSKAFKEVWRSPDVMKARGGLALFEFAIGEKIENVVQGLTAEGLYIAIDKQTEGVVLLACTESPEWIAEYIKKVVQLVRTDAQNKKQPDPIQEVLYRGIRAYEFQNAMVGTLGSVLMVTNKPQLGKDIVDRFVDSTEDHLASNALYQSFQSVASTQPKDPARTGFARGFLDLGTLREAGIAKEVLGMKRKDFAAELLLGGLFATLQKTPMATGNIELEADRIAVTLSAPYQSEWTQKSHSFFVGPEGHGVAPTLPSNDRFLASVSAYRNLSEMWHRAGDLFDETVNDQLAQADSTLTTLFSGKDFGSDILGAIEPQIQIVSVLQEFDSGNEPSVQLPSFALRAKLKEPNMKKELKRTYQSFIGFLNVAGAMAGQPQLDLDSESRDNVQFYTATFLKDSDRKYENGLPIQFNFSPTLAFDGDVVYVSSTVSLAKQLTRRVEKTDAPTAVDSPQPANLDNTRLELDSASLKEILQRNRQQIVSQNMLEKGHSKAEAEKEIEVLMNALSLLRSAALALRFDGQASFTIDLEFNADR